MKLNPRDRAFLSKKLRTLREAYRISQSRAASLCGVQPNTWARWERGELTPSATARKMIATIPAQVIQKDPERAIPTATVQALLTSIEFRDIMIRGGIGRRAEEGQHRAERQGQRVVINSIIHLLECDPPEIVAITSILKLLSRKGVKRR